MTNNIIYTLDYLKNEAKGIADYWDGKSETFIGGDGEIHSEDQAYAANELLVKIEEIEEIVKELHI